METAVPTLAYASGVRRFLAAVIDNFVISFLTAPFVGGSSRAFAEAITDGKPPSASDVALLTVVTVLVMVSYTTGMHAWRGVTLGKMAARTMLVNDDGSKVSVSTAFVRSVALASIFFVSTFALSIPLVLNELRPFWNRRRQTFHDTIARTVVVRADAAPQEPNGLG